MRNYNIPIFIPHEGCPHDCIFCNQRKITGITTTVTPEDAEKIIAEHLEYLPKCEKRVEAAFFGGSFTGLPIKLQELFYCAATKYKPEINGIRISTRPDYINEEILDLARLWGVTMIELGAQSAVDEVLCMNNRGHSFDQTCRAVEKIRRYGISVGVQMMTGMYGSNPEYDVKTARLLAELNPDCARVYPVLVLKDTGLEKLYRQGKYVPQTLEAAIETAKAVLNEFSKRKIPVIRMGLHAGKDLREPGAVVAGPFHPAFGELVDNRIWRDRIEERLLQMKNTSGVLEIEVPKREISKAVGHKRCNLKYFKERYNTDIKIISKNE